MDDTLRNVGIALGALFAIHIGLDARAHHAAVRQVSEAFDNTGAVHVQICPSGLLGLEVNDLASVRIDGTNQRSAHLPFYVFPRPGWKGSIEHLRITLSSYWLAGLPVSLFEADIPGVTYDLGHALYRARLVLRGAGSGSAHVHISPDGLRVFILKKFQKTLSDVIVLINNKKIVASGQIKFLGPPTPFRAVGRLKARDGRYLDLVEPDLVIGGRSVDPVMATTLLRQINPVLDIYEDLGLKGYFEIDNVEIGETEVVINGVATLPQAPPGARTP